VKIPWLASALQDLRHGAVLLWRDAGLSSLIVTVLALGLGGTAAIFTLLNAASWTLCRIAMRTGWSLSPMTTAGT